MNCDRVAFDVFRTTIKGTVHLRTDVLDYEACSQLCKVVASAKSYYYKGKTKDCHCLSGTFAKNVEHIDRFGAPKGCPITLNSASCVSRLGIISISFEFLIRLGKVPHPLSV